jgi:acyl-CoA thioesterase FadM
MSPDPTAMEQAQKHWPLLQFKAAVFYGTEQQIKTLIEKAMAARITSIQQCHDAKNDVWSFSVPTEHAETVNAWFPL